VRRLSDLQPKARAVLQLILFGQQELEGVLAAEGMEQFQHRVIASCKLEPMSARETKAYLKYRLAAAGWSGSPSFTGPAIVAIYRHSHGVPRYVNKICSRLMLHGSTMEKHLLEESDVEAVVDDLRKERLAPRKTASEHNVLKLRNGEHETDGIGSAVESRAKDSEARTPSTKPDQSAKGGNRKKPAKTSRFLRTLRASTGIVAGFAVLALLAWQWEPTPPITPRPAVTSETVGADLPSVASSVLQTSGYISSYGSSADAFSAPTPPTTGLNGGQYRADQTGSAPQVHTLTGHGFPLLDSNAATDIQLSAENEDVQTPLLQRVISNTPMGLLDDNALMTRPAADAPLQANDGSDS
jgi:hypothetical protein